MSWNGAIPHKDPNRVKGLRNKRKQKSAKALQAKQIQQAMREVALASIFESRDSEYGVDDNRRKRRRRNTEEY